jgi:YHS domain-containing protein
MFYNLSYRLQTGGFPVFVLPLEHKSSQMKFSQIILASAMVLMLGSCGRIFKDETKSTAPAPKKVIEIPLSSLAIKNDPVCGMTLKEVADTTTYQGKTYGFCGSGCKDEFVKNPGQYLTQQ